MTQYLNRRSAEQDPASVTVLGRRAFRRREARRRGWLATDARLDALYAAYCRGVRMAGGPR